MTDRYAVVFSDEAAADLENIYVHIRLGSGFPVRVREYVARLSEFAHGLDVFPHRGADRSDLVEGMRILGSRRQVTITYRIDEQSRTVEILRFLRRGLDWSSDPD